MIKIRVFITRSLCGWGHWFKLGLPTNVRAHRKETNEDIDLSRRCFGETWARLSGASEDFLQVVFGGWHRLGRFG